MLMVLFLAVSLSLDALGIGASYGVRKIAIPFFTKVILTFESLLLMGLSIFLGSQMTVLFSEKAAKYLGVGLLTVMGLWLLVQGLSKEKQQKQETDAKSPMAMVRTPSACDRDQSFCLDAKEAVYLGLVLSIDSLGAGIGAGAAGISILKLSISIALFQITFLTLGTALGRKIATFSDLPESLWSVISGGLLIGIAFLRVVI